MSKESPIVRKIRALLAMASDTSLTEVEALEFNRKAYELLAAHNLSVSDVTAAEKAEGVVELRIDDVNTNVWRVEIYSAVAELYFCRIYIKSYSIISNGRYVGRKSTVIVGKAHNTEIAASMAQYLIKTTLRLAKNFSSYRRDVLQFEKGCGLRLGARIREMAERQQAPQPRIAGNSGLPALYRQELALADAHMDTLDLKMGRAASLKFRDAASYGASAANNVNLGGQIGSAGAGRMLR